jgi:hypothetical protein
LAKERQKKTAEKTTRQEGRLQWRQSSAIYGPTLLTGTISHCELNLWGTHPHKKWTKGKPRYYLSSGKFARDSPYVMAGTYGSRGLSQRHLTPLTKQAATGGSMITINNPVCRARTALSDNLWLDKFRIERHQLARQFAFRINYSI